MRSHLAAIIKWRAIIALAGAALTCISLYGLTRQQYDDSFRNMFRSDSEEFRNFEQLRTEFKNSDNRCLLLLESDQLLARECLQTVSLLHREILNMESVAGVDSVFSLRRPVRRGKYLLPLLSPESDDEYWNSSIESLKTHPLAKGHLLSTDERSTLLIITLAGDDLSVPEIKTLLDSIEQVTQRLMEPVPIEYSMTGLPSLRMEIVESVQRDQIVFSLSAIVLVLAVAWFIFGNIVAITMAFIPPVIGAIWTVGLMGIFGEQLNVLNVVVPNMLLVIGFSDSVHLLFGIRKEFSRGVSPTEAAETTLSTVGPACVLTSLTTAIGFGSLVLAEDELIQRFGFVCAAGTILTMIAVVTTVPIVASTRIGKSCGTRASRLFASTDNRSMARFVEGVMRHAGKVVAIGVVVLGILLWGSFNLSPDFRYTENLPSSSPALKAYQKCDQYFHGAELVYVVVELPDESGLGWREMAGLLEEIEVVLTNSDIVSSPLSLLDLLKSLPGEGSETISRMPELKHIPPEVRINFIDLKTDQLLVSGHVRDIGSARLQPEFKSLELELSRVEKNHEGTTLTLTGIPVMSTFRSQTMISDLTKSLGLAALLIFGVIALSMRSIRLGLISILPNLFPLVALGSAMVAVGMPLRYSGILCFCICLGIAVDDTIHFLNRYQHEIDQGGSANGATRNSFMTIAPVLVTTTLLMLIGFVTVTLSSVPTIRQFGLLASFSLLSALFSDLVLLPALLTQRGART